MTVFPFFSRFQEFLRISNSSNESLTKVYIPHIGIIETYVTPLSLSKKNSLHSFKYLTRRRRL